MQGLLDLNSDFFGEGRLFSEKKLNITSWSKCSNILRHIGKKEIGW